MVELRTDDANYERRLQDLQLFQQDVLTYPFTVKKKYLDEGKKTEINEVDEHCKLLVFSSQAILCDDGAKYRAKRISAAKWFIENEPDHPILTMWEATQISQDEGDELLEAWNEQLKKTPSLIVRFHAAKFFEQRELKRSLDILQSVFSESSLSHTPQRHVHLLCWGIMHEPYADPEILEKTKALVKILPAPSQSANPRFRCRTSLDQAAWWGGLALVCFAISFVYPQSSRIVKSVLNLLIVLGIISGLWAFLCIRRAFASKMISSNSNDLSK